MGIHVHVKGQPDMCGCCAVKEKLDTLWDRASGAVLTINGVYPDAMGAITVDLLQEAAVQSLIEDYINPMQDNLDAMNTRLDGYTDIFDNYGAILQAVNVTIPGEIDDVQVYAEAIADDLLQNYLTKQAIISGYATKAEIQGLATRQDIQNVINGYIAKQGTATPQVISGTGGLQIAGDLAVGGDFTVSSDTFVHWDNIAGAEIGPIIISGTSINIPGYVTLDTPQIITGHKTFNDLACTTPPTGASSEAVVNKAYVETTDPATKLNNLLHDVGAETARGIKTFLDPIMGAITNGRINTNETLDIDSEHDGMNIYHIFANQVSALKGTPVGIEGGGAILYHSRIYGWGDTNNAYTYYHQMLISSSGHIFARRHIRIRNKTTNEVTWGNEKWKRYSFTEVDAS